MGLIKYSKRIKTQALSLRASGKSYKEIADELGVAKSTARLWTRNITLSPDAKKILYTSGVKKMMEGSLNARTRRLKEIEKIITDAREEINQPINDSSFKLLGAMLYWAEGNKDGQFAIANSDPLLIKFIVEWMRIVFKSEYSDMKAHLNIYPQQNENEIKRFWSELTNIPLSNFGKTFVKPKNNNFKKNTLYHGTIRIRLIKSGNRLHQTFAWVRSLLADMEIDVDEVVTRWNTLKTDYGRENIGLSKKPKID